MIYGHFRENVSKMIKKPLGFSLFRTWESGKLQTLIKPVKYCHFEWPPAAGIRPARRPRAGPTGWILPFGCHFLMSLFESFFRVADFRIPINRPFSLVGICGIQNWSPKLLDKMPPKNRETLKTRYMPWFAFWQMEHGRWEGLGNGPKMVQKCAFLSL